MEKCDMKKTERKWILTGMAAAMTVGITAGTAFAAAASAENVPSIFDVTVEEG